MTKYVVGAEIPGATTFPAIGEIGRDIASQATAYAS